MRRALVFSLLALLLVACGNKGPLVLPIDATSPVTIVVQ
ncbi:lipoprotein [Reinekea marina]|uniref:Lipoprotein n=1 Tax=Reinekea marina TaxID=1310421 RepID=A0ABV7WXF1_9GAMM|nr:lipoprotein [Reinekea forsetii]